MRIIRPTTVALTNSNVAETDYAEWSAATTYALGAYCIKASTHRVYKSLQNSNLNNDPATEADPSNPVHWQDVGATNRWKMFDDLVNSQTTNADSIAVALTTADRADSVVLLNVSAATVNITVTDDTDGEVYNKTFGMVSDSGIQELYSYFFEPITRKTDLAVSGLPPYTGAHVVVTLTDAGATAACGECIVGLSREIGITEAGARIGIRDYSVKAQDDFGNYTILERAYSKRGTFTVWVDGGFVSTLQTILAGYRATPIVYIGADDLDATLIYGFFKDFDIDIAYADVSICSIEIEGLT